MFLPSILDFISAYIPKKDLPPSLNKLLEAGASWETTLIIVTFLLLRAAFLVHLEIMNRLEAYEFQAPDYELEIKNVSCNLCSNRCHVEVCCNLGIRGTNAFSGDLIRVVAESKNQIKGLDPWEILSVYYGNYGSTLPKTIPNSDFELIIKIHAKLFKETIESMSRDGWRNAKILIHLVYRYFTQPVGLVQKVLPIELLVDLRDQFDLLLDWYQATLE